LFHKRFFGSTSSCSAQLLLSTWQFKKTKCHTRFWFDYGILILKGGCAERMRAISAGVCDKRTANNAQHVYVSRPFIYWMGSCSTGFCSRTIVLSTTVFLNFGLRNIGGASGRMCDVKFFRIAGSTSRRRKFDFENNLATRISIPMFVPAATIGSLPSSRLNNLDTFSERLTIGRNSFFNSSMSF